MKFIPGFEGRYSATKDGRIYSHLSGKYLKGNPDAKQYQRIRLYYADGSSKWFRLHRLIALTYLPLPSGYTAEELDVGHKDDNPANNNLDNLYWCTRKENLNAEHFLNICRNKDNTPIPVRCVETGQIYESIAEAGRQTGISRHGINDCLLGYHKTAKGYHWEKVKINQNIDNKTEE